MADSDDDPSDYASPACFLHELNPDYLGFTQPRAEVLRWRKDERKRLIAERLAVSATERAVHTVVIMTALDTLFGEMTGRIISVYWPFRGEPDLRDWMTSASARGATCALPVVSEKNAPLRFRAWKRGDRMERGIWNILVPADGKEVIPNVVIAPLVGFDSACYRLGYGGGYFDRTLAQLGREPLVIGVGYNRQQISTIHPQPHDIPMDLIVTEAGVVLRRGA